MSLLLEQQIARLEPLDADAIEAARIRQNQLTKPPGSLGRLEQLVLQIAGIRGVACPHIDQPVVIILAADHGVARQGVSAYPADVTPQMVQNFLNGGAAINVLACHVGVRVVVADLGVAAEIPAHPDLIARKIGYGTNDFSVAPAMTRTQALQALEAGIEIAQHQIGQGADIIATGDMGIGNTTASSALIAAFTLRRNALVGRLDNNGAHLHDTVIAVTGRGTGIDDTGLATKIAVIERALALHAPDPTDPIGVLAALGGFEIAGLAGVMIGAAAKHVPIVIDGFISGAAALVATQIAPAVQPYLIAGHQSVERGHQVALAALGLVPLLQLDLRLGEGTGAVLALSLCLAACKIQNEMATFAEAGVIGGTA